MSSREELIFVFQFAIGGVGNDIGTDCQCRVDLSGCCGRKLRAVWAAEFPEAGKTWQGRGFILARRGRIDQAGSAAVVDPEEGALKLWVDQLLGMPGGMLWGQEIQLVFRLGKDLADQLAKFLVKVLTVGAG